MQANVTQTPEGEDIRPAEAILDALVAERRWIEHAPEALPAVLYSNLRRQGWDAHEIAGALQLRPGEPSLRLQQWIPSGATGAQGHGGGVVGLAIVPRRTRGWEVLSWADDGSVCLWSGGNEPPQRVLRPHRGGVTAAVVLADREHIVTAGRDGMIRRTRILPLEEEPATTTIGWHDGEVLGVAFVPDAPAGATRNPAPAERRILSWSADGTLRLWDLETGQLDVTMSGHQGAVSACALTLGGRYAVSGSYDHTLRIWEIATGRSMAVIEGHTAPVTAVFVSHDQRHVVSCSLDRSVRVWRVWNGATNPNPDEALRPRGPEPVATLQNHKLAISGGRLSPGGHRLATWSYDGEVRVWDLAGVVNGDNLFDPMAVLRGHSAGAVLDAAFGEPGQLVTASADRTLRIWDLASGSAQVLLERHTGAVRCCLAVSGREGFLFYSGSDDRSVRIWSESGYMGGVLNGSARAVNACLRDRTNWSARIFGKGDQVHTSVAGSAESEVLFKLPQPGDLVRGLVQSPDGRFLVAWARGPQLHVRGVLARMGSEMTRSLEPGGHTGVPPSVLACAIRRDSCFALAGYTDHKLRLWELERGELAATLSGHRAPVVDVAVTHDDMRAVSASWDGTLGVWDLGSGARLATLEGHTDRVLACAVHPRQQVAASASADGTLRLWALGSHRQLAVLIGHAAEVTHCAFTREGELVSASRDGTVRVWDGSQGGERLVLSGHTDWITGLAVDEERGILYSCSLDGTVRAWRLGSGVRVGVFYGESPFRCIAALPDGLLAGDEAGNLWEVEVDENAAAGEPLAQRSSDPERFPLDFRPTESYREGARRYGAERARGRKHPGCDLHAPVDTPVYALDDGEVMRVSPFYLGTYALEVRHSRYIARYGELQPNVPPEVRQGARVRKGQLLGYVGRLEGMTESMLHLELYSGEATGPLTVTDKPPYLRRSDLIDPTPVLDRAILP